METKTIPFTYEEYDSPEELQPHDRDLLSCAKEALKNGIRDYLIKGEYDQKELTRAIRFATYSHVNPKRDNWAKRLLAL